MALLTELKKRMASESVDHLIHLLCVPDEELRFSQWVDISSTGEAKLLDSELFSRADLQAKLVRRLITPLLLQRIGPAALLDNARIVRALDEQGILKRIPYLHTQMVTMHDRMTRHVASSGPLPAAKRAVAFGLGGSAIGSFLAREIIQNHGYSLPLDIHTSYPASFHGINSDTLVLLCSYSGNTEEVLYAFEHAAKRTDKMLILSRGGKLAKLSKKVRFVEIPESDIQQPRESIGFWLGALLFIISSLGLAKRDDGTVYRFGISELDRIKPRLDRIDRMCAEETPFAENPAKQYAAYFLYGTRGGQTLPETDWQHPRVPVVFLDDADRAIGKRLANQFGECVEHPILLLVLCEDAHNEIESVATVMLEEELREEARSRSFILISSRPHDLPTAGRGERRAVQRMEATLQTLFKQHDVDFLRIEAEGDSLLERKLCLLKLLDYTRAYASILRGTPPLPVVFMHLMKRKMEGIPEARQR